MPFIVKDEDLFPDCMLPNCPRHASEGRHAHVLPHQGDILTCDTKYLYCQGGVGSAKSVAFAARCVKLSLEVDENSGVVGRKDYKLLYRSAWQDIKACIKKLVRLNYFERYDIDLSNYEKKFYSAKKQGDYSTITFPNDSIAYAIQTKAWEEGLGPSYGWYWIDDGMESSEEMFVGHETSAGLISRLRLPTANFHRNVNGEITSKLSGMVSSNPPPHNHWLHKLFGAQPGVFKIGTDTVTHLRVETFLNPFVGDDYASGIMSIQSKMGRSTDTARRVIFGESVPSYGGVKVYPQFKHQIHVGEFSFKPELPLVTGWDFGLAHPAVTFSNIFKCTSGKNHLITLSELSQLFEVTIYDVYAAYKAHVDEFYSNASRIFYAGDKSGYRQSTNRKDKRGDIRILQSEYGLFFKYGYFDLTNSIKYCRILLNETCQCGLPIIQIDKRAKVLIEALEGGYKFPKHRDGSTGDRPIKDKYYDDVADAWRYAVENYVKRGVTYRDEVSPSYKKHKPAAKPWDWMEMSSDELMNAILS